MVSFFPCSGRSVYRKAVITGSERVVFRLQLHFAPSTALRPYLGPGVIYTHLFDTDTMGPLDISPCVYRANAGLRF